MSRECCWPIIMGGKTTTLRPKGSRLGRGQAGKETNHLAVGQKDHFKIKATC